MATEEERCAEARKLLRIDEAFTAGDLDALRAALDDPGAVPNGPMPDTVGPCLIHAIYKSPLAFIRTLLDLGADANVPVDDGFPTLIAALSCSRAALGVTPRTDVDEILRLLLSSGADPNQRGINDYTPLHMAVEAGNPHAVQLLLERGADPDLRTGIDAYETPLEMATASGQDVIAGILAARGRPLERRLRSGLTLLAEVPGTGDAVRRQHPYRIRFRLWLNDGEPVRWRMAWGPVGAARLDDGGETLVTDVWVNRGSLPNGLFYGLDGMRVGGMRRVRMAPHLGYGERGVPDVIPPHAVLTAEFTVLAACR